MAKTVGLRAEVLITLSLLLGAALLFGGLVMLRFTEASLLEERVGQLDAYVHLVERLSADSSLDATFASEKIIGLIFSGAVQCRTWRLYDRDLNMTGQWQSDEGKQHDTPPSLLELNQVNRSRSLQKRVVIPSLLHIFTGQDSYARYLVPLNQNNRFSGLLDLRFSLNDITQKLFQSQVLIVVYILLYGAVLIAAGYYLLLRNIIKPARALLTATDAVGKGTFDQRLPVAGPTEIRQLAEAYNGMVVALQHSRSETEDHIRNLEGANQKLAETRNELVQREKLASVGQLAAGLAHELGNPLAALIGYLELLKSQIQNAGQSDLIERSLTETGRIDFLVRELLDFSRPDKNNEEEDVDLVATLMFSVKLLENQGAFQDVSVATSFPEEPIASVRMNKNKLQQVFINILLNAVQACAKEGRIQLAAGQGAEGVWISIKDNGHGIPTSEIDRIFDPFYTTKEPGQGTGLGLAICQRIVEESGGKILAMSEFASWSCFKLVWIL